MTFAHPKGCGVGEKLFFFSQWRYVSSISGEFFMFERQPDLPKMKIYQLDSTRVDVYLLPSKNLPNQIVSDNSPEFCASSWQGLLSISKDGKFQRFTQRLITCFTTSICLWLRDAWTFAKLFSPRIPKRKTKLHQPQLLCTVDPFTHRIVAVHLISDQAGHE